MTAQLGPTKAEYIRQWKLRNPEKVAAGRKRYQEKNREKIRERLKKWRLERLEKDPEYYKNRSKKYNAVNREYRAAWSRARYPAPTRPEPNICECCGKERDKGQKKLHLDHCHSLGIFRGWLCASCNLGIGLLGDGPSGVMKALEYLKRAYDGTIGA